MARGARQVISTALLDAVRKDVLEDWKQYGRETLSRVREDNPEVYLSFVAKVLPRPADSANQGINNAVIITWAGEELALEKPKCRVLEHEAPAIKETIGRPGHIAVDSDNDEDE